MIRDLDIRVAIGFYIKRYVFSFKSIIQIAAGQKSGKMTLQIIGKALVFIDKPSNRVPVRRLRETLRKPTVSGVLLHPPFAHGQ